MDCAILIQTCDKYKKFWGGFFNFFEKHWDFNIDCPIYFCNESEEISLPNGFNQIKTGKGTFVQNLNKALDSISQKNIFFLLEDFWPIAPMRKDLFCELFEYFIENNLDCLQVGPFTPYYKLENTKKKIRKQKTWRIKKDSDWLFNFQARFWNKQTLKDCLAEPEVSEEKVNSAITVEHSSNKLAQKKAITVDFYHYFWYPIGGVAYRGDFTKIGEDMQNIVNIDELTKNLTH
jgi:hypothetical protein